MGHRAQTIRVNRLSNHQLRESVRAERDVILGVATFTETAPMLAPMLIPNLAPTVFARPAQRTATSGPSRGQPAIEPFTANTMVRTDRDKDRAAADGPTSASLGAVRPRSDGA